MLRDSRDIIRRLEREEFVLVGVRGSHHQYKHADGLLPRCARCHRGGNTFEAVMREGAIALGFAFEDWEGPLPEPRTIEELRRDPEFVDWSKDAIIVAVKPATGVAAAAE